MSEVIDRWSETAQLFTSRIAAIGPDDWVLPSPCAEWNVRQLVDHAVATQGRFGGLLGVQADSTDWPALHSAMIAFLGADDALDGTVDVAGLGPMTRAQILEICVNDLLVHTWDVARSIGVDEALPERLVVACFNWLKGLPESVLRSGRYRAARLVDPGASTQAQMLAFAGREP